MASPWTCHSEYDDDAVIGRDERTTSINGI